ncbi:MAG: C1 family peptidase [Halobacteriota archaeon]
MARTIKDMGWLPDTPDFRDYTPKTKSVATLLERTGVLRGVSRAPENLPPSVDLRQWCSTVDDQGWLGSCTANAGVGLLEYFERKAFNKFTDASRRFLYKITRNMMGVTGDTGAFPRNTMEAMTLVGVPPEWYWPYTDQSPDFDIEPPGWVYSIAERFEAVQYYSLSAACVPGDMLLQDVKTWLAGGLPLMFGFPVFHRVLVQSKTNGGRFPFPCADTDFFVGGHAIDVVGYDDDLKIANIDCGLETRGALLIRNSWGTEWGELGYGWLPYEYVVQGMTDDWWTLIQGSWVNTDAFGFG